LDRPPPRDRALVTHDIGAGRALFRYYIEASRVQWAPGRGTAALAGSGSN
jgi:hypothetical protein